MERFEKKIKNLHTVRLAPGIAEKDEILIDKFSVLLNPYPDEKSRAAAVFEQTGADMYLFPRFREKRIQVDTSPRTEFDVKLSSWTEESGGSDGYKTYDKKTWTEHHVIPEKKVYLYIMELEIKGKDKAGTINIGFKNIDLPADVGDDEYSLKGAYFGMKFEATEKLKGVSVITDATSDKDLDYYVTGTVDRWKMYSTWHLPEVTTWPEHISSEEEKWIDDKGKEHKKLIKKYRDKIIDHYAYWSFSWNVRATFRLVDAKTGKVVVSESGTEFNDKPMDAYRKILRNFYGQVNKYFKK